MKLTVVIPAFNEARAIKTTLKRIDDFLAGKGFDYEIIFLAEKMGYKIKEVPVEWKDNHESKVTAGGYLKALSELFAIRINNFLGRYN